jgi:hypothetical protein
MMLNLIFVATALRGGALDAPETMSPPRDAPLQGLHWSFFRHDEPVGSSGLEEFLPNRKVRIYVLKWRPILLGWLPFFDWLPDETKLRGANLRAIVTTNDDGRTPPFDVGILPPGIYFLIADYNSDGVYTNGLDAHKVCVVRPSPKK